MVPAMVGKADKESCCGLDQVDKTKTLICALNLISRNLPLPPHVFHSVNSILQTADNNVDDGLAADTLDCSSNSTKDACGISSYGDLIMEFEDAVVKQRPKLMSSNLLTELNQSRFQSRVEHRLNELEELPTSRGEDLQSKCLLELYGLKLAELQKKLRSDVSSEFWLRLKCVYPEQQLFDWGMTRLCFPFYGLGDPFAAETDDQLRKKRDAERLSRLEEEEKSYVETRKRRFFGDLLNAAREFQLQVGASLKRQKQRNDGVMAWHGRQRQRATRQEKLRMDALKKDDQEAYMKMVKESKNERLTMLLGKTNDLLVSLGAAVQRQKDANHSVGIEPLDESDADTPDLDVLKEGSSVPDENIDESDEESVKAGNLLDGQKKYNSVVHSIEEKVTEQPATLQGGELRPYQIEGLQWMLSLFNNNLNDHLWIKWIQSINLKNASWDEYEINSTASWYWKKICQTRDKLKAGFNAGIWGISGKEYSIRRGYEWLQGQQQPVPWHISVWSRFSYPRHRFIVWLIQHEKLLTRDRLFKHGICSEKECVICGQTEESHQHLFFRCHYSQECLKQVRIWLGMQIPNQDIWEWSRRCSMKSKIQRHVLWMCLNSLAYHIWNSRNKARVELQVISPAHLSLKIKTECKGRLSNLSMNGITSRMQNWIKQLQDRD